MPDDRGPHARHRSAARFQAPFRACLHDDGSPGGAKLLDDRPPSFLAASDGPGLEPFGVLLDGEIDDLAKTFGDLQTST